MPQLYELVNPDEMTWLTFNGWVNETFHPTEPLAILKYSKRAVPGADCWTVDAIHHCRGLIYNTDSGEIVARPFKKFWNYGEPGAARIPLDAKSVQVYDKVDGSLGIGYALPSDPDKLRIATCSSFTSEQAIRANQILDRKYPSVPTTWHYTPLFEIVYPENRIVLDYGDQEDLVLLGGVDIRNGDVHGPEFFSDDWDGPVVQRFEYPTLASALAAPPRENAEGFVIRWGIDNQMIKVKQQDYVDLHRIVFGLSEKMVWKHLRDYGGTELLIEGVPEEFQEWIRKVEGRLLGEAARIEEAIRTEYGEIVWNIDWAALADQFPGNGSEECRRANAKAFAAEVANHNSPHKWALFLLFHGKGDQIRQILLEKHLEPMGRTGISPADRDQED
jgi:putative RNA ligase